MTLALAPRGTHRDPRHVRPATPDHLHDWVYAYTGIRIAREAVCRGHHAPFDAFCCWQLDRPLVALALGPRGGGKSFLSAIDTHLHSRFHPGYGTRIVGGSLAQSRQIYGGLRLGVQRSRGPLGTDRDRFAALNVTRARYTNGSEVEILAASTTSSRGPHVPSLKIDEIDELTQKRDVFESAMGMAQEFKGMPTSVVMTSTWHRPDGLMGEKIAEAERLAEEGKTREMPLHRFCTFEVLERCPASRSGPPTGTADLYENCPACPIKKWCHAEVVPHPETGELLPKAKRSAGHYTIDSLIQKTRLVSLRVFEADYLCLGPRADGLFFPEFDPAVHVVADQADAEYSPLWPVTLAIDSGVHTGAVWFQLIKPNARRGARPDEFDPDSELRVFADHYAYDVPAERVARDIRRAGETVCGGRCDVRATDPAGDARNPIGPSVLAEYAKGGLSDFARWPRYPGSVNDGLALIESFLAPADGKVRLKIHPRCKHLIEAFRNYRRKNVRGQWLDAPEDPQHPGEDLMDALRGGLLVHFPAGHRPGPKLNRMYAGRVI